MNYNNIVKATFINRPNRFIANCIVDGKTEVVHVKNTGRCKELLVQGASVYLQYCDNKNRKTKYDLISVYKNGILINMDSQIPNKVFKEGILNTSIILPNLHNIDTIKSEVTYGNSRFDFFVKDIKGKECFCEIKGVTLEEDGIVMFPDAPTIRGIKHINELIKAKKEGYEACLVFIVQLSGCKYFTPNPIHKDFVEALKLAKSSGVNILCYECKIDELSINIHKSLEIKL